MKLSPTEIDKMLDDLLVESDPVTKLQGAGFVLQGALKSNYDLGAAAAHVVQGTALWQTSLFPEAINALDKASAYLSRIPNCQWHALLHFGYGNAYRELGVLDQALENFLAALKISNEIQNEELAIKAEGNIGTVAVVRGDYQKGIDAFLTVLNLATDAKHRQMRISAYINLAAAYYYAGDYPNAVIMGQNALLRASAPNDLSAAHGNLGSAYTGLGDYEKAKHHLENSFELAREAHLVDEQCVCYVDLADYYIKTNEDDRAIQLLNEGLSLAQTIDFKAGIRDCHQRLHALFRKQGNWEHALLHHEQWHDVDKAMFNDNSDARMRNLETFHKVEQLREVNELQRRELDTLAQMSNALLSDLSHDLKNPITALRFCFDLLRKVAAGLPGEYQQQFEDLHNRGEAQIERMTQLIKDVLDMARYDTGAGIELQRTNARDLIDEVCMGLHEQAAGKNIALNYSRDGALHILADTGAIRRVLENLVSNAIKYTAKGGQVEVEAAQTNDKTVVIRVKDNGLGIPEDQLPRIFERFYRVPSHREIAEGTGLGMAIVKSIVDKHKGTIDIASIVNHGTTVTVTLPAV